MAVVAIGVDAGDKAAAEARDPRMELSAYALHEDAAMVLCRGRQRTRQSLRCLDERDLNYIYILTSTFSHRLAAALRRPLPAAIGRKGS
jgi:hypothetical protein